MQATSSRVAMVQNPATSHRIYAQNTSAPLLHHFCTKFTCFMFIAHAKRLKNMFKINRIAPVYAMFPNVRSGHPCLI